jgi:hypothetical protein
MTKFGPTFQDRPGRAESTGREAGHPTHENATGAILGDSGGVSVWDDLVERATEREVLAGLDPMAVTEAGGPDLVVRTLNPTGTTYPTTSPAVFACSIIELTFDEEEGATVTETVLSGTVYIYNCTSIVPPIGQRWIASRIGDRLGMAYTGVPR